MIGALVSALLRLGERVVVQVHDFRQWLLGVWQVRIRHLDRRITFETAGAVAPPPSMRRMAIVAVYPSNASLPFTRNLLGALCETGFFVLVVSDRPLGTSVRQELAHECHHLVERAAVGADFGSYKVGLAWLDRRVGLAEQLDALVVANDSLFYPKCFREELANMVACPSYWQAPFQSFESGHHGQSFCMMFRAAVFRSPAFRNFWTGYHPYTWRWHRVHRGELELSSVLRKAGFELHARYTSSRLVKALLDDETKWGLRQIAEVAPAHDPTFGRDGILRNAANIAAVTADDSDDDPPDAAKIERQYWAYWWGRQMETANPTHVTGLMLNAVLRAPIKRDVCYRGFFDIFQVLRFATAFDEGELEAMRSDLSLRALSVSSHGLRRVLWKYSRI